MSQFYVGNLCDKRRKPFSHSLSRMQVVSLVTEKHGNPQTTHWARIALYSVFANAGTQHKHTRVWTGDDCAFPFADPCSCRTTVHIQLHNQRIVCHSQMENMFLFRWIQNPTEFVHMHAFWKRHSIEHFPRVNIRMAQAKNVCMEKQLKQCFSSINSRSASFQQGEKSTWIILLWARHELWLTLNPLTLVRCWEYGRCSAVSYVFELNSLSIYSPVRADSRRLKCSLTTHTRKAISKTAQNFRAKWIEWAIVFTGRK